MLPPTDNPTTICATWVCSPPPHRSRVCAGGGLNWDTVRVAVAAHPEWFLRDRNGAVFYVPWVANDPTFFGHENFWYPSPCTDPISTRSSP